MNEHLRLFGKLFAPVLIACHLLAISMALWSPLHHLIHHDADDQDHHCAANAVLDGAMDVSDHSPIESPLPHFSGTVCFGISSQVFRPSPYFAGAGERAPPSRAVTS